MNNLIIQLIGFIGLVFLVLSFQQNNRNKILVLILTGQLIFLAHFILIGAWTAVAMNTVGALRTLIFQYKETKRWAERYFWPFIFILGFILSGLLAWQEWYSVLPIIAMSIETVGLWMNKPKAIRFINLFPHPLWFTYNLIMMSWAGITVEVMIFISILIAIYRYDIKHQKGKNNYIKSY